MIASLTFTLGLIEGGLRLGGWLMVRNPPVWGEERLAGRHVILALGDSNVYGWRCSGQDAYPGQLQRELDQGAPRRYAVVNVGLPGMNSAEVVARFDGWAKEFGADTAIVTVGVNNSWIQGVSTPSAPRAGVRGLKLFRLYRIIRSGLAGSAEPGPHAGRPELEKQDLEGGSIVEQRNAATGELLLRHQGNPNRRKPYSTSTAVRTLTEDLRTLHQKAARRGIRLVIATYAGARVSGLTSQLADETTATNVALRNFANEHELLLIDVEPRFQELLAERGRRKDFFLTEVEAHPNPKGYREIAGLVARVLERADAAGPAGWESGTSSRRP